MQKIIYLFLIMGFVLCGCSGNGKTSKAKDGTDTVYVSSTAVDTTSDSSTDEDGEDETMDVTTTDDEAVYICTGGYAKRYHLDRFCSGLSSCRGDIEAVSLEEAEDEGRTPCHKCAY